MRRIRPASGVAGAVVLVTALLWIPPAARAASVAAIVEKYGLTGTWAADCATAPSARNPHVIYRLLDDERLQRETRIEPGKSLDVTEAHSIVEIQAGELMMGWKTREGGVTNRVRAAEGQMQVQESTRDSGEKIFANGRRLRDNTEAPKFNKCP
jgi:hypothetical protein